MAIGWLLLLCLDGRRPRRLALVACGRCSLLLQLLPFLMSSSCHCRRRYVSLWHHHHRCCCVMSFVVASRRVMSSHHVLSFVVLLTWKEASQTSISVQWTTTTTISHSNFTYFKVSDIAVALRWGWLSSLFCVVAVLIGDFVSSLVVVARWSSLFTSEKQTVATKQIDNKSQYLYLLRRFPCRRGDSLADCRQCSDRICVVAITRWWCQCQSRNFWIFVAVKVPLRVHGLVCHRRPWSELPLASDPLLTIIMPTPPIQGLWRRYFRCA